MPEQITAQTDLDAKRADQLAIGERVLEEIEYGKGLQAARIVAVEPYANGDKRPMIAALLATDDGREPMYARYRAEQMIDLASPELIAAAKDAERRQAMAQVLRRLADDIVDLDMPLPKYRLHVTGCLDSRAEVERWAKHLDVEVRLGGTQENIPVANKELDVLDGLMVDLQFQSDPEPEASTEQAGE